jgi:hypothetical protein
VVLNSLNRERSNREVVLLVNAVHTRPRKIDQNLLHNGKEPFSDTKNPRDSYADPVSPHTFEHR